MTFIHFDKADLKVDDLLQGDVKLASPPEIYVRLHRMLERPDTTFAMLAEVIECDPALAARLLRVANSPFFGVPHKVHGILEALNLLGVREVQHLVLATEVMQRFETVPQELLDLYAYWRESIRCAVLARALAEGRAAHGDPEAIFIGALLHGIGHLVIYTRIPELGRKALVESRHRSLPLHRVQRAVMGFDYAEVGAALARHWELPEFIAEVLAHHLAPEQAGRFRPEAALVHLALAAAQARSFVPAEVRAALPRQEAIWKEAGVTPEALETALPRAEGDFAAALSLLG